MIKREDFLKNEELKLDKSVGALCGLAIGDSLGDAARMEHNRATYGITTDFNKGASWSTDDTEFALLTAKIVLDTKGEFTSDDVAKIWIETMGSQTEYKRGGKSEIAAITNLLKGITPPNSGRFNAFAESDGAAMRIAPIGIICAGDPEKAARLAEIEARVSHYGEGIISAQCISSAVSVAMVDGTIDEILNASVNCMPKDSWMYYNTMKAFEIVEKNDFNIINSWMELHDELEAHYWAASPEAIPAALACMKMCNKTFKEGVILASNYARDADTIGAVTGAILGAKYGRKSIPDKWVEKTRHASGTCLEFTNGLDIVNIGEQLSKLIN